MLRVPEVTYTGRLARNKTPQLITASLGVPSLLLLVKKMIELITSIGFEADFLYGFYG